MFRTFSSHPANVSDLDTLLSIIIYLIYTGCYHIHLCRRTRKKTNCTNWMNVCKKNPILLAIWQAVRAGMISYCISFGSGGASLAERLVSSTLNLLALLRVGSNPGLGDSNFHEGKSPGWLREGRWFYPDAWLILYGQLGIWGLPPSN